MTSSVTPEVHNVSQRSQSAPETPEKDRDRDIGNMVKKPRDEGIYRLTVQTLPDGLETQFTPPDTTQTGPSCSVWRAV